MLYYNNLVNPDFMKKYLKLLLLFIEPSTLIAKNNAGKKVS